VIFSQPYEHSNFETEHRSLAAFGEATIGLGAGLELKPGVRAEVTRKEMSRVERIPAQDSYTRERNSSALLPKLELGYTVDASTSLSARWAAGYKPGGFSAFTGKRELAVFGPERSHGIDLAFRRGSVVRGLDVVVRAFGYEIDGYQIERSFQTGGMADDYLVVNAEKARSVGGEVEAVWKPLSGLEITATYGITRARLESFSDPYTQMSYDGNRAPYVPSRDLAVAMRYDHVSGVFAEARVAQVGRTFYTEAEDGAFSQASYSLVGGRLGWSSKLWEISGYVENATDREYYASIIPGTFHATPGAPRTYGVQVRAMF
jgi:outer membrane receptor protein involved in Fe transport